MDECANCFCSIQPDDETRLDPRLGFVHADPLLCALLSDDRYNPQSIGADVDYGPRRPALEEAT